MYIALLWAQLKKVECINSFKNLNHGVDGRLNMPVVHLEFQKTFFLFFQEMAEEERDAILSRKEMVSGENMQLIMEAEHSR